MISYTYVEKGKFVLTEKPKPVLCDDRDAIVKVTLGSICTSDLHIRNGSVPKAVPGITVGPVSYTHLLPAEDIIAQAKASSEQGVLRYSIVTSGRRLSEEEVHRMCDVIRQIRRETGISVCVSFGLLEESQFRKLKEAGVTRVHNNCLLYTSRCV